MPAHAQPPRPRTALGLLWRGAHLLRGLLATTVLTVLVAGIPWGLACYIGWPLPHHLPTWPEVNAVLLAPMSTTFLLHTLACILWPVWGAFVLDVARATTDQVRAGPRPTLPKTGPLNSLATVLVATIIMTLVSRPLTPAAAAPAPFVTASATTTTSSPTPRPATLIAFTQATATAFRTSHDIGIAGTVEVKLPHDGIYDSLWRIADRTLGDGSRWPEIYALNRRRPQPDGHTLTQPSLIRPGWILRIPADWSISGTHHTPAPPATASPHPPQSSTPTAPSEASSPSPSQPTHTSPPSSSPTAPSTPNAPSRPLPVHRPHRQPGVSLSTGAFVGIGLAALISAALLTVRRRRRMRYRPGSGDRDDLIIAPVVRALRLAHDNAIRTDDADDLSLLVESRSAAAEAVQPPGEIPEVGAPTPSPVGSRVIGVKDGQALAWNLARARGLGLIGPGALDAMRALLISLLAEKSRQPATGPVEILIPATDASLLMGENTNHPAGVHIVDDLDAALDTMEVELLARTGTDAASNTASPQAGDLVLVATPAPHADRRLQAVLDNGSTLGLVGILFGPWRPGATARIRSDGTVATTDSSVADVLGGARLFTLPSADAQCLLDLLHDAQSGQYRRAERPPVVPSAPPAVSGPRDLGTDARAPRPTTTRPRRRPAQGPAPRLDAQQPPAGENDRHQADADTVSGDEASAATRDDDRPPANATSQALQVLDPELTSSIADDESDRGIPFAKEGPRGPYTAMPADPTTAAPPPSASADESLTMLRPLQLAVLGRMRLTHHQTGGGEHADLSPTLAPKQRELLAYMALHRDGVRREALATALWPDAPRDRPFNSFHATLSQLRRALRTATHGALRDVTVHEDGLYGLDRGQITVDLWHLQDALETSRNDAHGQDRRTASERVVELYSGDFAANLTAEWIEAPREALRRDVLDTVSALVRILREDEPEQASALLERARALDRYNEAIYRDIARLQARLGRHDAIPRTLALLTTTLAEIDEEPSQETLALCASLQRPQPAGRRPSGRAAR
ncbi:hypothetical protein ACFZDK_27650 [Streptomyces sp. NPDC007901]|uniref:hypothetical protein n=1 Tax=Streptomyces sp. NPDC007901 TaxID=3364785 RepID=UPI0036E40987